MKESLILTSLSTTKRICHHNEWTLIFLSSDEPKPIFQRSFANSDSVNSTDLGQNVSTYSSDSILYAETLCPYIRGPFRNRKGGLSCHDMCGYGFPWYSLMMYRSCGCGSGLAWIKYEAVCSIDTELNHYYLISVICACLQTG